MTSPRRHPNVVNLAELEPSTIERGDKFGCRNRRLGLATGGTGLSCGWFEIAPGKTAFPRHYHLANEEALFVLEGSGTLHIGADQVAVGPGDYVTFPVGPDHAHQLFNTGATPLRYLCLATMHPVEVVGYPDSDKVGAFVAGPPGQPPRFRGIYKRGATVDYFDGE